MLADRNDESLSLGKSKKEALQTLKIPPQCRTTTIISLSLSLSHFPIPTEIPPQPYVNLASFKLTGSHKLISVLTI